MRGVASSGVWSLILICLGSYVAFAAESPAPPLPQSMVSLKSAYFEALKKTEALPAQESKFLQAQELENQAFGALLPNVNFSVARLQQDNSAVPALTANTLIGKFTLTQPLFKSGAEYAGLAAVKAKVRSQDASREATKWSLYATVGKAFMSVLSSEKDVENLKVSQSLTTQRVTDLESRARIGRSRRGEVLSARAQLASLQAQLEAALASARSAREDFTVATGLDRDTPLDPAGPELELPQQMPDLNAYLYRMESRPELVALKEAAVASDESVWVSKAGHLPTLDLSGNYYLARDNLSTSGLKWDVTLTLTVPLFAGGITQSKVRDALETQRQSELALAQSRRQADATLRTLHENVSSGLAQIRLLQEALTAAEFNYQEQQKDYRYGLVTNLDVLSALTTLQDTRRSLDKTKYSVLSQWIQLQALMGELPKSISDSPAPVPAGESP